MINTQHPGSVCDAASHGYRSDDKSRPRCRCKTELAGGSRGGITGAVVKNDCQQDMIGQLFKIGGIMTAVIHSKSERIDVRASAPVKQLLQEAARVAHKNVSEFLLDASIIAANQTLADRARFELSDEKWLAFQAALDQPVSAKPKLKKLLSEPGLLG